MTKKNRLYINIIKNKFPLFWQNTQGVYMPMMALLSFVLIGYIAFVVDGTGLILDKVRLTQGLEQAGFFLTAEDNYFRDKKDIAEVTLQNNLKTQEEIDQLSKKEKDQYEQLVNAFKQNAQDNKININDKEKKQFAYKQYLRNLQMIQGIARSYYLPDSYVGYTDNGNPVNNFNISDNFTYQCHKIKGSNNIGCKVNGHFDRPSWLYWGKEYKQEFGTTFDRTEKVTANTVYVTKKRQAPIYDIMFILDASGSMDHCLKTDDEYGKCNKNESPESLNKKINALKFAIKEISGKILESNPNGNIRIGYTAYNFGAQELGNNQQCLLPYVLSDKALIPQGFKILKLDSDYISNDLQYMVDKKICTQFWPSKRKYCKTQYINHYKGQIQCNYEGQAIKQPNRGLEDMVTYCNCSIKRCGWQYNNGWSHGNSIKVKKLEDIPYYASFKEYFQNELNNFEYTSHNSANYNKEKNDNYNFLTDALSKPFYTSYNHHKEDVFDINRTLDLIDLFEKGKPYPKTNNMIKLKKGGKTPCFPKRGSMYQTTQQWFTKKDPFINSVINSNILDGGGSTLSSSGLLIGAQLMMNGRDPDVEKQNTHRIIIIVSDGLDGAGSAYNPPQITEKLINAGMCERIRNKLDSIKTKTNPNALNSSNYDLYKTNISFIMLGNDPEQTRINGELVKKYNKAWKKCVGEENYHPVNNSIELLKAFQNITEEVGTAVDEEPNFN